MSVAKIAESVKTCTMSLFKIADKALGNCAKRELNTMFSVYQRRWFKISSGQEFENETVVTLYFWDIF